MTETFSNFWLFSGRLFGFVLLGVDQFVDYQPVISAFFSRRLNGKQEATLSS